MGNGKVYFILAFLGALGCGIMGGVYFAFSTFVMSGLARIPAREGNAAMQSINAAVGGSLFGLTFLVVPLIALIAVIYAIIGWNRPGAAYLLAGGLIFLVGELAVTLIFNVPLNNALAATDPGHADAANVWSGYLRNWVAWNHVRTLASLAASAVFTLALRN